MELKDEFDRGIREIGSHTSNFCMLIVNCFSTVEVESPLWGLPAGSQDNTSISHPGNDPEQRLSSEGLLHAIREVDPEKAPGWGSVYDPEEDAGWTSIRGA